MDTRPMRSRVARSEDLNGTPRSKTEETCQQHRNADPPSKTPLAKALARLKREHDDPIVATELKEARKKFRQAAAEDERLALLFFVNPIRAYADAGAVLSKHTRQAISDASPQSSFAPDEVYEGIRDGKIKIPWIKRIRVLQE